MNNTISISRNKSFYKLVLGWIMVMSTTSSGINFLSAQSLPEIIWNYALENSPRLKAAQLELEASSKLEKSVGVWPDLELQAGVFSRAMEYMMGDQRLELQAMQMLPQNSMIRAQRNELSAMTQVRQAVYESITRQLRHEMSDLWIRRSALEAEIQLKKQALELIAQIQNLAEAKMATGGRQSDLIRLQLLRTIMEADIQMMHVRTAGMDASLLALIGAETAFDLPLADNILRPRISTTDMNIPLIDHPMVKMEQAESLAATARSEMASAEKRPMVGLGLQYMPIKPRTDAMGMSTSGDDMLMPMMGLSIPMSRSKRNAKREAAVVVARSYEARSQEQISKLHSKWAQTIAEFRQAEIMADVTDEQVRLSKMLYETALAEYESGQNSMEELLMIQQTWLDYEMKKLEAYIELHLSLNSLEELQPKIQKTYEND